MSPIRENVSTWVCPLSAIVHVSSARFFSRFMANPLATAIMHGRPVCIVAARPVRMSKAYGVRQACTHTRVCFAYSPGASRRATVPGNSVCLFVYAADGNAIHIITGNTVKSKSRIRFCINSVYKNMFF